MYLSQLSIQHVRNLTAVHLECCPGINYICGDNAAGKTAILEAIHLLSRARSFRTPRVREVIQHGEDRLIVTAHIDSNGKRMVTGLEKSAQTTHIRFAGEKVLRRSEQALKIPLFTVASDNQRLLEGGPRERRHWLDWAMFHVEPDYIHVWQDYQRALRQRNTLLRSEANSGQFDGWEQTMTAAAGKLQTYRQAYLAALCKYAQSLVEELFDRQLQITLWPEMEGETGLLQQFYKDRSTDIRLGHTRRGPHRQDVRFLIGTCEAGRILSRGESKLLIILLILAQAQEYRERTGQIPMLLIDDFSAELDSKTQAFIQDLLAAQPQQLFITNISDQLAETGSASGRMFHVERGHIAKVVK